MNNNYYIFWDTETGSVDPNTCEVLSLGAVVVHPRTLQIVQGSEFYSLIKPEIKENVEAKALEVNKLNLDELDKAPSLESVWNNFVKYVKKYKSGNNKWGNPVAAGFNILNYDMVICERLNEKFGHKEIFHPRDSLDLIGDFFRWFENDKEIKSLSLDNLREYMGMSKDDAHNALQDSKDSALIGIRMLNLYRGIRPRFYNAFGGKNENS